jgi:hypothetical protein
MFFMFLQNVPFRLCFSMFCQNLRFDSTHANTLSYPHIIRLSKNAAADIQQQKQYTILAAASASLKS